MIAVLQRKLVPLGQVVATPGALQVLAESGQSALEFLHRHGTGDCGEVHFEDQALNDQSMEDGTRILSAYRTVKGIRPWIITEADRAATTILLPEEY